MTITGSLLHQIIPQNISLCRVQDNRKWRFKRTYTCASVWTRDTNCLKGLTWEFRCGAAGNAGKVIPARGSHWVQQKGWQNIRKPHLLKGSRELPGGWRASRLKSGRRGKFRHEPVAQLSITAVLKIRLRKSQNSTHSRDLVEERKIEV